MTATQSIPSRLRSLREERGWNQTELAERLQTTQQIVSMWEVGKHAPSLDMALRLARVLDVSLDELVGRDGV